MAKPKFSLKKPAATSPTLISIVYRFGFEKFVYSTGESIHPDFWDKASQRAKTNLKGNPAQLAANKETNLQLDRYHLKLTEILAGLTATNQPITIEALREAMDKEFLKETHHRRVAEEAKKPTMLAWIDNWIKTVKHTRETPPRPINPRTVLKYKATLKILQSFSKDKRKGRLDFDGINMDFYFDFTEYLRDTYKHTPNTIGKHITIVKLFLREAVDAGLTTNLTHENRKFAAPKEAVEHVFLNDAELALIAKLDLSKSPRLDRVRDLFLIGCYTALRFSDFTAIKPENIITTSTGGRALKITTFKTSQTVVVPIHTTVEAILQKYENALPRAISNQKMNKYLKDIGKAAEIKSKVQITKTIGGKRVQTSIEKWNLITTHTARRSGATNMFLAGVPSLAIMKITGHKTESVFMKYICIDEEVNANLLMQHEYFRPKMKVV